MEIGDSFHILGGFFARLTVLDKGGKLLSTNTDDLTGEEIEAFVTSEVRFEDDTNPVHFLECRRRVFMLLAVCLLRPCPQVP